MKVRVKSGRWWGVIFTSVFISLTSSVIASAQSTPAPTPAAAAAAAASASNSSGAPIPASPNPSQIAQAQQQLQQTQDQASKVDTALGQMQQNLAQAQAQLATLDAQTKQLNAEVAADQATVAYIEEQLKQDKKMLTNYLRQAYESGNDSSLVYILGAPDFSNMLTRISDENRMGSAVTSLVQKIQDEQVNAKKLLEETQTKQQQSVAAQEQAKTVTAMIAIDEQKLQIASYNIHSNVAQAQANLTDLEAMQRLYLNAVQALQDAKATGQIFPPIPGSTFTEDTDLTLPSGETASNINTFLAGTPLAGLGQSYLDAESKYHVSARYLVAHSVEESAWGTSAIAHDKHNIFGYGANDANPYVDALTFNSFADCINFVAQKVAENYLSPTGSYYHGPTLRGMNVSYATDPNWAANIARIADTIP